MGKKNKKEKKGKGKEKTEQKAEKKADKRLKKELAEKGEEDIEKLIAEFQEQDRRRVEVIEEKSPPPTPRCSLSLVAHPDRDELLMFGGEYFTGNKMYVYNDLYVFQIKKKEWLKVSIPNPPPPRSAHQALTMGQEGGQMWVFGGEFSSHSQAQFYHYKDLWLLHLKEKRWEQIKAPGGPTARSGHRMAALKKKLFVFGGFHDNTRDYKYFSDVYVFNTETYTWSSIVPSGNGPAPRSGCVLFPVPDASKLLVYGGYSKEKVKKDKDVGKTFTDMFALALEKKKESAPEVEKWKWQSVKQSGTRPSQRSGMAGIAVPGNKAFLFGGVFDEEEDDEDLESNFFKDLWTLDLDKAKWFQGQLRGKKAAGGEKKRRRRKEKDETKTGEDSDEDEDEEGEEDHEEEEEMEDAKDALENLELKEGEKDGAAACSSDGVFTITQSSTPASETGSKTSDVCMDVDQFWPSPRMNTSLAVRDGIVYMYGGMIEEGDKQLTMADFYSLDVNKMEEWSVIIAEDRKLQEWHDSGESGDEDEPGAKSAKKRPHDDDDDNDDDDEDDDDSDDSMEITFDDAPLRGEGEGIVDYFTRSQDYWVEKARSFYEEEGETVGERRLVRFAKELCEEACGK